MQNQRRRPRDMFCWTPTGLVPVARGKPGEQGAEEGEQLPDAPPSNLPKERQLVGGEIQGHFGMPIVNHPGFLHGPGVVAPPGGYLPRQLRTAAVPYPPHAGPFQSSMAQGQMEPLEAKPIMAGSTLQGSYGDRYTIPAAPPSGGFPMGEGGRYRSVQPQVMDAWSRYPQKSTLK